MEKTSFFDIYTEVSTDSGNTWQPTTSGPVTVTLQPAVLLEIDCPPDISVLDVQPFASAGLANSFFDVFAEIDIGSSVDLLDESGNTTSVSLDKQWQVLSPPTLSIESVFSSAALQLSWPLPSDGYQLKSCTNLGPMAVWQTVTNTPVIDTVGGHKQVLFDPSCPNQFFKLYRPLPRAVE